MKLTVTNTKKELLFVNLQPSEYFLTFDEMLFIKIAPIIDKNNTGLNAISITHKEVVFLKDNVAVTPVKIDEIIITKL